MARIDALVKSGSSGKFEQGVAAVEFALVLIPLFLIVAGVVEFGRTFWYYDALAKATRDSARLMSMADKDSITSAKEAAENMAVSVANDARISPALSADNVLVECLSASYVSQTCTNGTAPSNVRVTIVDFSVDIGSWIPFVSMSGGSGWNDVLLSPSTTMRYMCTGAGSC